jgi:hypothetical protein
MKWNREGTRRGEPIMKDTKGHEDEEKKLRS